MPKGTAPGTYWAVITFTIDSGGGHPIILGPTKTNGVTVVDNTLPMSKVITANCHNATAEAYDDETWVENVTLYYRYSEDNETWGNWTEFGTDHESPWFWEHDSPEGDGYYEFYTLARDAGNNTEEIPAIADISHNAKTGGIPGFEFQVILISMLIALIVHRKRNYRL